MPLHFQNGKAIEKLVPASTKTVKVMGPQAVPEAVLHELLAAVAAHGLLADVATTAGAMADEMRHALAHLGDGAWLDGHSGFDRGVPGNAHRWIERYLRGLAVPSRDDPLP